MRLEVSEWPKTFIDRILATDLGTATTALISEGAKGVMVAYRNRHTEPVAL